jgi:hypothetical protein
MTFADAIGGFGFSIKEKNLLEAYSRSGTAFKFQMVQNFVVLKEHVELDHPLGY